MGKVDADLGMGEKWKTAGAELGEGQQQSARVHGARGGVFWGIMQETAMSLERKEMVGEWNQRPRSCVRMHAIGHVSQQDRKAQSSLFQDTENVWIWKSF